MTHILSKVDHTLLSQNATWGEIKAVLDDGIKYSCASCCIPVVSKPIEIEGKAYFDGGLAEPIPFRKAFDDGCDKIVVVLSAPAEQKKDKIPGTAILGNTILRE